MKKYSGEVILAPVSKDDDMKICEGREGEDLGTR